MGEKCHPLDTCISLSSREESKKCIVLYSPKSDLSDEVKRWQSGPGASDFRLIQFVVSFVPGIIISNIFKVNFN